jgi:hypothetical protein
MMRIMFEHLERANCNPHAVDKSDTLNELTVRMPLPSIKALWDIAET